MNKKVRWGIIILIAVIIAGLAVKGLLPKRNSDMEAAPTATNTQQSNARRTLNVNAIIIKEQRLVQDEAVTGRLYPDEEVDLSFQTSGIITRLTFSEGTNVKKGELLAKVNDAPLQAQLQKLEAQLKLAEDRVFRQSALLQKDAVSREAYEQVKTDLEALKADIQLVKANIDLTELRAPFDGVIGLRQVSIGAYASPTTVLAKLTKYSPIKVEFDISDKSSNYIKRGTQISFTLENNPNTYYGTVYATDSSIDQTFKTLTVRALYPNANGALRPGSFANVLIRTIDVPNAITIPSEAIVPEMGVDKVFLYKSGKAQPITITKGVRSESQVQVTDGLHVGDTLIVSGTLQLRTGLSVSLDNVN